MDLDAITLRPLDDLLANHCVVGRQYTGEVAIGQILTEPGNPEMIELRDRMRRNFTGEWAKHSVHTWAHYFKNTNTECHIVPHAQFFPFSWRREDLKELFDGSGYDWSEAY